MDRSRLRRPHASPSEPQAPSGIDPSRAPRRIGSPWWVVAGVFLVLAVSSGFGFHNLSVYMNALADERGFAVAALSGAVALNFLAGGITGVLVGRWIERFEIRWAMVGGAAVGGVALAGIGQATEMWQVFALHALFGAGNSGVSMIPATTVVTRWFPGANRSLALSVASTGLSAGGVLLTPLSAHVVHLLGVHQALAWFGLCYFLAVAGVATLMVRSWPAGGERQMARRGVPGVRSALRSRFFVGATAAYVGIMASQVGGIAHLFNYVERLTDHVAASLAVSLMGLSSIVGRLLGGVLLAGGGPQGAGGFRWTGPTVPIRSFTCVNIALQGGGLALLAGAQSAPAAYAATLMFGFSIGNLLMLQPLLMAQAFGVERYPRVFAAANAAATLGVAGGPLVMGILHDTASYATSFAAAAVAAAVALALFAAAGPLPRPDDAHRPS